MLQLAVLQQKGWSNTMGALKMWAMLIIILIILDLMIEVILPLCQPAVDRLISWIISKMFPPQSQMRSKPVFVPEEAPWLGTSLNENQDQKE